MSQIDERKMRETHTHTSYYVHLVTKPTQIMKAQIIPLEAPDVSIPRSVLFVLLPVYIYFLQLFVFLWSEVLRAKKNCVPPFL